MQIGKRSSFLYYLGKFVFKWMFILIYRCKSSGQENIPENTGFIIAPNHMSFFDPPLAGCFMKQDLYFMAKQELFDTPILGSVIKRTNAFPRSIKINNFSHSTIIKYKNLHRSNFGLPN